MAEKARKARKAWNSEGYTPNGDYPTFKAWIEQNLDIKLIPEYKFNHARKYRFDYACVEYMIAIEIEGGVFGKKGKKCECCGRSQGGAHGSVSGILRDIHKYNLAQSCGWTVLRFIPAKLMTSESLELIGKALDCKAMLLSQ